MSLLTSIKHIAHKDVLNTFMALVFLVAPGVLVIFVYDRELFITIDSLKLLLLALSFTAPLTILNAFFLFEPIHDSERKPEDHPWFRTLVLSALISGFIIYVPVTISWLASLSIYSFLGMIAVFEIFLIIGEKIEQRRLSKNKN